MSFPCCRPSSVYDEPIAPTPPKRPDSVWVQPEHVVWNTISPRNVQLVSGMTRRACQGCFTDHPERVLIRYRGKRLCPACFASETARARSEANARLSRPSLAARALAHMEQVRRDAAIPDADLAAQNCPECVP